MGGEQRGNPYAAPRRTAGDNQPGGDDAANVLSYFPEAERQSSSVTAMWWLTMPALCFVIVVGVTGSATGALVVGLLALGAGYWKRRRSRVIPRAKLRIEQETLYLSGPAFAAPMAIPLGQLLDVYLDTKTIQRVQENTGTLPQLRFLNATVSGEMDTARIALELEKETFFLTEQRVSHTDANEWFSKIRRFLRKHGWLPDDERAA
jgi:hypothetical protein